MLLIRLLTINIFIVLTILLLSLLTSSLSSSVSRQRSYVNLRKISNLGNIPYYYKSSERQSGIMSTLLAGPVLLALSSLLLSVPVLPLLLLAPLAIANLPSLDTSSNEINPTISTIDEVLQTLQQLGSTFTKPVSSSSTSLQSSSPSTLSLSSSTSLVNKTLQADSSITTSPSSSPIATSIFSSNPNANNIVDLLAPGFLNQLASINDVLVNNNPSDESINNLQQLATNTINSISNFLFTSKRSEPLFKLPFLNKRSSILKIHRPKRVINYIQDIYSTLREGLRRYDINEPDCQARLLCELNKKALGKSFGTWFAVLMDTTGLEYRLENSKFEHGIKNHLKDLYEAMKKGLKKEECSLIYAKCPIAVALEPMTNTIFGKFMGSNIKNNRDYKLRSSLRILSSSLKSGFKGFNRYFY